MQKFTLSLAHLQKRKEKKHFSLRYDIFGSYLMRELSTEDYFDFCFSYPRAADRILIDGMFSGDWYSVYESAFLPRRKAAFLEKFQERGIDVFGEFLRKIQGEGKECFLAYRISETAIDAKENPIAAHAEHPDWFIPAFGYLMHNMAAKELREHKLRVLEEVMRKYPFDGLDIDFERHTPILPPGHQWEMRDCVTDFMRRLREMLCRIEEETGRTVQLSARVPDCLRGCHEDGLDIETWLREELVDALTMGSRSYDVHAEDIRAIAPDLQLFACYELHHTLDGYALPPIEVVRGVFYAWQKRGADGVECFNWTGQGNLDTVRKYLERYNQDPAKHMELLSSKDDFRGAGDPAFLEGENKTYVVDRRGGYPWGVGFGNLNEDKQLPLAIRGDGAVRFYLPEDIAHYRKATLHLLLAETEERPALFFGDTPLSYRASPKKDPQITTLASPPPSGYGIYSLLAEGKAEQKPCTLLEADLTGLHTEEGMLLLRIQSAAPITVEKAEIHCEI